VLGGAVDGWDGWALSRQASPGRPDQRQSKINSGFGELGEREQRRRGMGVGPARHDLDREVSPVKKAAPVSLLGLLGREGGPLARLGWVELLRGLRGEEAYRQRAGRALTGRSAAKARKVDARMETGRQGQAPDGRVERRRAMHASELQLHRLQPPDGDRPPPSLRRRTSRAEQSRSDAPRGGLPQRASVADLFWGRARSTSTSTSSGASDG